MTSRSHHNTDIYYPDFANNIPVTSASADIYHGYTSRRYRPSATNSRPLPPPYNNLETTSRTVPVSHVYYKTPYLNCLTICHDFASIQLNNVLGLETES